MEKKCPPGPAGDARSFCMFSFKVGSDVGNQVGDTQVGDAPWGAAQCTWAFADALGGVFSVFEQMRPRVCIEN